jgi:hypothetical protein
VIRAPEGHEAREDVVEAGSARRPVVGEELDMQTIPWLEQDVQVREERLFHDKVGRVLLQDECPERWARSMRSR